MHANGSSKLHTRDLFYRFLNLSWDTTHKSASTSSSTPTGGTSYFSFRHNCKGNSKSRACASSLECVGNDVTCITCCQTTPTVWNFFSHDIKCNCFGAINTLLHLCNHVHSIKFHVDWAEKSTWTSITNYTDLDYSHFFTKLIKTGIFRKSYADPDYNRHK